MAEPRTHTAFLAEARGHRMFGLVLLIAVILSVQTVGNNLSGPIQVVRANPPDTTPFQYIAIILMENTGFDSLAQNPSAPYINSLAGQYGLATNYTAVAHPSLPNYLDLTSATNSGITTDCDPTVCPVTAPNIVDRIESAGLTWKAWAEDYPLNQGCSLQSSNAAYAPRHFPFVYYQDIVNNPSRCSNLYAANSVVSSNPETDDLFLKALGSTSTAANYMWLTPNLCDDIHDCSISTGDTYLSQLVPAILNSYVFTTQQAALFITFDEGSASYPSDYVYTVWAGPAAKNHYQSSTQYSHFSLLKTIETAWDLQSLTTNDGSALSMSAFLTGSTGTQPASTSGPCLLCFSSPMILVFVGVAGVSLVSVQAFRLRRKDETDDDSDIIEPGRFDSRSDQEDD